MKRTPGFSLVEICVAAAIMAIVLVAMMKYGSISNQQQMQGNAKFFADQVRRNLVQNLLNPAAWQATVADTANLNLDCLRANTSCTGKGGPFRIRDAANQIVYDPLASAGNGYTVSGEACTGFDAVQGSDVCPLRMDLNWRPICSPPCVGPQVRVIGTLAFRPGTGKKSAVINPANYGFDLIVGGAPPLRSLAGSDSADSNNGATCYETTAGVCNIIDGATGYFYKDIVFVQPFAAAPSVLVSAARLSFEPTSCAAGTTDYVQVEAQNITPTGFRLVCMGSPASGFCGTAHVHRTRGRCNWIAVGS